LPLPSRDVGGAGRGDGDDEVLPTPCFDRPALLRDGDDDPSPLSCTILDLAVTECVPVDRLLCLLPIQKDARWEDKFGHKHFFTKFNPI
jgi:hypothetical protein